MEAPQIAVAELKKKKEEKHSITRKYSYRIGRDTEIICVII